MVSHLDDTKIANRYAKALFEKALEDQETEAVLDDLHAVNEVIADVADFNTFFNAPQVALQQKQDFVNSTFAKKVHPLVLKLMQLMTEKNRMTVFPSLVCQYQALVNTHNNIATAEVVTAVSLTKTIEKKIQSTLEKVYGYKAVQLEHRVDPGILGGIVIKIEDQVIDGSYRGRLEALRKLAG